MHASLRAVLPTALLLAITGTAQGQAGRADLRYVAPLPDVVTFTSTDTVRNTVSGLPTGDMDMSGTMRSVVEMRFRPDGDSTAVTATLKEMNGRMSTPMGDMPMNVTDAPPIEFNIGPTGPSPEHVPEMLGGLPSQGNSQEVLSSTRAIAGILVLPGRELSLGETWTDTVRVEPQTDAFTMDMTIVTHGTYVSDTIVDGRTLNVLRIESTMQSTGTGAAQGIQMKQTMSLTGEETVLWDSLLHLPVHRDAVTRLEAETDMPAQGMTMLMDTRTRSITTAQPGG